MWWVSIYLLQIVNFVSDIYKPSAEDIIYLLDAYLLQIVNFVSDIYKPPAEDIIYLLDVNVSYIK